MCFKACQNHNTNKSSFNLNSKQICVLFVLLMFKKRTLQAAADSQEGAIEPQSLLDQFQDTQVFGEEEEEHFLTQAMSQKDEPGVPDSSTGDNTGASQRDAVDQSDDGADAEGEPPDDQPGDRPDGADEAEKNKPQKKRARITLNQMTPESKKNELERRAQAKRDNSNRWHAKWISKGVPKDPALPSDPQPAAPAAPAAPQSPVDDVELTVENVLANEGLRSDMRKVRAIFMSQWIADAEKKNPGASQKLLQNEANKNWLESELRAQLLAARKGTQY